MKPICVLVSSKWSEILLDEPLIATQLSWNIPSIFFNVQSLSYISYNLINMISIPWSLFVQQKKSPITFYPLNDRTRNQTTETIQTKTKAPWSQIVHKDPSKKYFIPLSLKLSLLKECLETPYVFRDIWWHHLQHLNMSDGLKIKHDYQDVLGWGSLSNSIWNPGGRVFKIGWKKGQYISNDRYVMNGLQALFWIVTF